MIFLDSFVQLLSSHCRSCRMFGAFVPMWCSPVTSVYALSIKPLGLMEAWNVPGKMWGRCSSLNTWLTLPGELEEKLLPEGESETEGQGEAVGTKATGRQPNRNPSARYRRLRPWKTRCLLMKCTPDSQFTFCSSQRPDDGVPVSKEWQVQGDDYENGPDGCVAEHSFTLC